MDHFNSGVRSMLLLFNSGTQLSLLGSAKSFKSAHILPSYASLYVYVRRNFIP